MKIFNIHYYNVTRNLRETKIQQLMKKLYGSRPHLIRDQTYKHQKVRRYISGVYTPNPSKQEDGTSTKSLVK